MADDLTFRSAVHGLKKDHDAFTEYLRLHPGSCSSCVRYELTCNVEPRSPSCSPCTSRKVKCSLHLDFFFDRTRHFFQERSDFDAALEDIWIRRTRKKNAPPDRKPSVVSHPADSWARGPDGPSSVPIPALLSFNSEVHPPIPATPPSPPAHNVNLVPSPSGAGSQTVLADPSGFSQRSASVHDADTPASHVFALPSLLSSDALAEFDRPALLELISRLSERIASLEGRDTAQLRSPGLLLPDNIPYVCSEAVFRAHAHLSVAVYSLITRMCNLPHESALSSSATSVLEDASADIEYAMAEMIGDLDVCRSAHPASFSDP
ncbi:hypothetical protein FB451DRAFT_1293080 [Mycena latifolia]|nr:hypothetical protein FB451DRAFT_1293080 [Mycena latifolia]